jgi:hypothetical protein
MSERFRTDAEIDRAIDTVARAIASGQPRDGFVQRVRAKLEPPPRRTGSPWWQFATAAALVAIVGIGVMMRPPTLPAPVRPAAGSSDPTPPTSPAAPSRVERSEPPPPRGTATSLPVRFAADEPGIPPLREPAPIAVLVRPPEEIGFKETELGLNDLTLGALELAPLDTAKEPR